MSESTKKEVLMEEKVLPKIATRCLAMLMQVQRKAWDSTIEEAAESVGIALKDGWKLKSDGKAFVRRKEEKG